MMFHSDQVVAFHKAFVEIKMHRFYALSENIFGNRIFLDLDETKHLKNVLRLSEGNVVRVFDGNGNEFRCLVKRVTEKVELEIVEKEEPLAKESTLDLRLAVGILKGEKFDLVIQKAVELGVCRFTPLLTKRCQVRINEPKKKFERWQKIIIQASKQCGRAKLMKLENPVFFNEFIKKCSENIKAGEPYILFSERNGTSIANIKVLGNKATAIVGAEGGWDDEELQSASEKGIQIVTFSNKRILRAETAAIAVATIFQNRFGDLF
jgi:16S rRNA (uracil1498-N3)-methyltransferase